MLAGLDDSLGACRSGRERLSGRCFGGLTLTARVINALDRIFAVHHPVLSCLALELSIKHPAGEDGSDRLRWLKLIGIPLGIFLLLMVGATVWNVSNSTNATQMTGTAQAIGQSLFTDYLLPFELTSLLILIALMGAVVFAKKDL